MIFQNELDWKDKVLFKTQKNQMLNYTDVRREINVLMNDRIDDLCGRGI